MENTVEPIWHENPEEAIELITAVSIQRIFLNLLMDHGEPGMHWSELDNLCKKHELDAQVISDLINQPSAVAIKNGNLIHPIFDRKTSLLN